MEKNSQYFAKAFGLMSLLCASAGCVSTRVPLIVEDNLANNSPVRTNVTARIEKPIIYRTNMTERTYSTTNVAERAHTNSWSEVLQQTKPVTLSYSGTNTVFGEEITRVILKQAKANAPTNSISRYVGVASYDARTGKIYADNGAGAKELNALNSRLGIVTTRKAKAEIMDRVLGNYNHSQLTRLLVPYSGTMTTNIVSPVTNTVREIIRTREIQVQKNREIEKIVREEIPEIKVERKTEDKGLRALEELKVDSPVVAVADKDKGSFGIRVAFSGLGDLVKGIGTAIKDITQIIHPYRTKTEEGKQILDSKGMPARIWAPWWQFWGKNQEYSVVGSFYDSEDGGFLGGWNRKSWDDKAGRLAPFALLFAAGGGGGGNGESREEVSLPQNKREDREEPEPKPEPPIVDDWGTGNTRGN